jgi:hypothetical protein
VGLGLQVGADFSAREDDPEWAATLGPFARNIGSFGEEHAAIALLFDYLRTAQHNNLWAARPIVGTTIGDRDALGLTGTISLNNVSQTRLAGSLVTTTSQRVPDSFEAFWNREWSERANTEFAAGCQFSGVDEAVFRGELVYGITSSVDISVGGAVNTAGNYVCGISMSYHFSDLGRHDSIHNIHASGKPEFYTPFPKRGPTGVGGFGGRTAISSFGPGGGGGL